MLDICAVTPAPVADKFTVIAPPESIVMAVVPISPPLTVDRSTSKEIEQISHNLADGGWLARIEAECGRLPR